MALGRVQGAGNVRPPLRPFPQTQEEMSSSVRGGDAEPVAGERGRGQAGHPLTRLSPPPPHTVKWSRCLHVSYSLGHPGPRMPCESRHFSTSLRTTPRMAIFSSVVARGWRGARGTSLCSHPRAVLRPDSGPRQSKQSPKGASPPPWPPALPSRGPAGQTPGPFPEFHRPGVPRSVAQVPAVISPGVLSQPLKL